MNLELYVRSHNYEITIPLKNKITVLRGESGSGKSTLVSMLSKHSNTVRKVVRGTNYKIIPKVNFEGFLDELAVFEHRVYVCDSTCGTITNELAEAVRKSKDMFFVFINRDFMDALSFDLKDIYVCKRIKGSIKREVTEYLEFPTEEDAYKIDSTLIEGTNRLYKHLFELLNLGDIKYVDGKLEYLKNLYNDSIDNRVLCLIDRVNSGAYGDKLAHILNSHRGNVKFIDEYKAWEYLILESKLFHNEFIEYDSRTDEWEYTFYVNQLSALAEGIVLLFDRDKVTVIDVSDREFDGTPYTYASAEIDKLENLLLNRRFILLVNLVKRFK